MKYFENMKFAGKIVAAALAVAVIGTTTTTAFATERSVDTERSTAVECDTADLNSDVYQFTKDLSVGKAKIASDGMIEYSCDIKDLDRESLTIVDHSKDASGNSPKGSYGPYSFRWKCNPDTRHVSDEIYLRKDNGYIGAACLVDPTDKQFMLGVMDDCGHAQYVNGPSGAAHNFYGLKKAKYRVFVQNNYKNVTLYADVTYAYRYDD